MTIKSNHSPFADSLSKADYKSFDNSQNKFSPVSKLLAKALNYIISKSQSDESIYSNVDQLLKHIEPFYHELQFLNHLQTCVNHCNFEATHRLFEKCIGYTYPVRYLTRAAQKLFSVNKFIESDYLYCKILINTEASPTDRMNAYLYRGIIHFNLGQLLESQVYYFKALQEQSTINSHYWNGFDHCDEIIVLSPPGIGDILIAQRHALNLKQYANKISCLTIERIIPLLSLSSLYDEYSILDNKVIESKLSSGKNIKLVNQLHLFGVNNFLINLKPTCAYLTSDVECDQYWTHLFNSDKSFKIGLCWQGKEFSPNHPGRSFSLEDMSPIASISNISLISLQNGVGSEQLKQCSFSGKFTELTPEIDRKRDFINTASLIKQCDLVISCDTGIAQLSSALGVKTLVACQTKPSVWWSHQGGQSLMHESALVFSKKLNESWYELFERLQQYIISNIDIKKCLDR